MHFLQKVVSKKGEAAVHQNGFSSNLNKGGSFIERMGVCQCIIHYTNQYNVALKVGDSSSKSMI